MWKSNEYNDAEEMFLANMGKDSMTEVEAMFEKSEVNAYIIAGLKEAADLVRKGGYDRVVICGDYDADGITSTTILMDLFDYLGIECTFMIPKRFTEGYGFNKDMAARISYNTLIVCVDNGISCFNAIKEVKAKNCEVIILDHHLPVVKDGKEVLPDADVIVNPHIDSLGHSDFVDYCGAGLAWRFAREFGFDNADVRSLAMVGTIADCVTLREENYVLVKEGLKAVNESYGNMALLMLLHQMVKATKIEADDIGFSVAPCFNASSRLIDNGAVDVVNFLRDPDEVFLGELVRRNEERKELATDGKKLADKALESLDNVTCPCVLYLPTVSKGIVGIVAGYVAEKWHVPCFVFTDDGDNLTGSGRSVEGYDMKSMLDKISVNGLVYGGHVGAAGIHMPKTSMDAFCENITEASKGFSYTDNADKAYDLTLFSDEISEALENFDKFAPYGNGNPAPVYRITKLVAKNYKVNQKYARIDTETCKVVTFDPPEFKSLFLSKPETFSAIGKLSPDYFMTTVPRAQLQLVDVSF